MRNCNPIESLLSIIAFEIEKIVSIGLIICEENKYYYDENFCDIIKNGESVTRKRKDDETGGSSKKKFRLNFSFEEEKDKYESSNEDKEVIF